ncbi:twin-arginine translocation signal domain-containing protein [bacterium]|nr:MAG: twin-arginine translocation signal domain-containing protein [bacterium]
MDKREPGASRRDFLKLTGGALGGVMLGASVGCGGGGNVFARGGGPGVGDPLPGTPLPSGYLFYRVFTPQAGNNLFPDLNTLSGGVFNNDATIVFHGNRSTGQNAVYTLQLQYNGSAAPTIVDSSILISEGDTQAGLPVTKLISASVNNGGLFGPSFGSVVAAVETEGNPYGTVANNAGTPAVLLSPNGGNFERVVGHYDPAPGGGNFGAHFGDVAIDENNNIVVVSDFSRNTPQGVVVSQGVFYLPNGMTPAQGTLLAETAATGSTDSSLPVRFGRVDFDNGGNFLVQAFAPDSSGLRDAKGGKVVRSGVLAGKVGHAPELLAGTMGNRRSRYSSGGNVIMGPRIRNNVASVVTHTSDTSMTLNVGGTTLASTGGQSPNGNTIISVNPASVSSNGLAHYLVTHATGVELIVSNGTQQKTILNYGDSVSGTPIQGVVHGFHSHQSDSQGRIVLVGEFADGSQSIVVGIPV